MPITAPLELPMYPPKIPFVVKGLIPRGLVTTVFAHAGTGKTKIVANLAVQLTRPQGEFAGHPTAHGWVLILDGDDPSGYGYKSWLPRYLAHDEDADKSLLQVRTVEGGLTPEDLERLGQELEANPPALIVLDAFSSAFLGVDVLKAHVVAPPIRALASLAERTRSAVLLIDHVGKLQPGQTVAGKGPLGSSIKNAIPRAIFAISRVDPAETGGAEVLRLECTKQSYAAVPPPIGLEVHLSDDDSRAWISTVKLSGSRTLEEKAMEAARAILLGAGEAGIPLSELVSTVITHAHVSEKTARNALKRLREEMGPDITEHQAKTRGAPLTLSLTKRIATNEEKAVQNSELFVANEPATNPVPENDSSELREVLEL